MICIATDAFSFYAPSFPIIFSRISQVRSVRIQHRPAKSHLLVQKVSTPTACSHNGTLRNCTLHNGTSRHPLAVGKVGRAVNQARNCIVPQLFPPFNARHSLWCCRFSIFCFFRSRETFRASIQFRASVTTTAKAKQRKRPGWWSTGTATSTSEFHCIYLQCVPWRALAGG